MAATTIKKVTIEPVDVPLEHPFTIAIGVQYAIKTALITVTLENGVVGYGEAAPLESINGENQATVLATLHSCKEFLLGKDVADYRKISRHLKGVFWAQVTARCAVEMAMLDAFTKSVGLPLYKFLGGMEDKIETDYTVDIVTPAMARDNAAKLAAKGYRLLKIKVGKNIAEDIDRILAVTQGAPACGITLDANQGFSPMEAINFLEQLKKHNLHPVLFEQPVVKHDLMGMRFVKDHSFIPIAADESVFTPADAINVARAGCADVINIKLMKSGIVDALDIAAIARSANLKLMIGCMLETRLGLACSVHFAAGLGGFGFVDLDPHINPDHDPFTGGPDFGDPLYRLTDVPGIGVSKR